MMVDDGFVIFPVCGFYDEMYPGQYVFNGLQAKALYIRSPLTASRNCIHEFVPREILTV